METERGRLRLFVARSQDEFRRMEMPKTETPKSAGKAGKGFTGEELAAMKERAQEQKGAKKPDGEDEVLAKIAEMPEEDRALAQRIHELVKASAPGLSAKTWYGMPAYAKDGNVVCFFQSAHKFKTRYATLGFSDKAALDDGNAWPVAYAVRALTAADEAKIVALVKRAVG